MLAKVLDRVFIHKVNGEEVALTDPAASLSPEAVLNHYSGLYPILTTAKIVGPELEKDKVVYRFEAVMGTKG